MPTGTIVGLVLGPIYMKQEDQNDFEVCRQHMIDYMFTTAVQITAMSVPIILFYRAYPMNYPSKSAEEMDLIKQQKKKESKMWPELK